MPRLCIISSDYHSRSPLALRDFASAAVFPLTSICAVTYKILLSTPVPNFLGQFIPFSVPILPKLVTTPTCLHVFMEETCAKFFTF